MKIKAQRNYRQEISFLRRVLIISSILHELVCLLVIKSAPMVRVHKLLKGNPKERKKIFL